MGYYKTQLNNLLSDPKPAVRATDHFVVHSLSDGILVAFQGHVVGSSSINWIDSRLSREDYVIVAELMGKPELAQWDSSLDKRCR